MNLCFQDTWVPKLPWAKSRWAKFGQAFGVEVRFDVKAC